MFRMCVQKIWRRPAQIQVKSGKNTERCMCCDCLLLEIMTYSVYFIDFSGSAV